MYDTIEKLLNSVIQHGKQSKRIYLIKLDENDLPDLLDKLNNLAQQNNYTKIFTKVPVHLKKIFENDGYHQEAAIPAFFNGKTDLSYMCKFLSQERSIDNKIEQVKNVIDVSVEKGKNITKIEPSEQFQIRKCTQDEAEEIVSIYKKVFETYPFPIFDKDYIIGTMNSHIDYYCAVEEEKIVALASSEMDKDHKNVEMTDFATLPEYRGHNLSLILLDHMEKEMKNKSFYTTYTIARALSYGMNITFAKMGYIFGGTLINNTGICGSLESMNIWYKPL